MLRTQKIFSLTAVGVLCVIGCKKTPSANVGMAGMHIWSGISVDLHYDTTLHTLYKDTANVKFAMAIDVLDDKTISFVDSTSGGANRDTLSYISTDHSNNTMLFEGRTGGYKLSVSKHDSMIYNYSNKSISWYHREYSSFTPLMIVHTP